MARTKKTFYQILSTTWRRQLWCIFVWLCAQIMQQFLIQNRLKQYLSYLSPRIFWHLFLYGFCLYLQMVLFFSFLISQKASSLLPSPRVANKTEQADKTANLVQNQAQKAQN